MTRTNPPKLRTAQVIADEIGVPLSRVLYVLETRPHIKPAALAGRTRLYDHSVVPKVRYELNAIDARTDCWQFRKGGQR